jgi:hypothetical protein
MEILCTLIKYLMIGFGKADNDKMHDFNIRIYKNWSDIPKFVSNIYNIHQIWLNFCLVCILCLW